MIKEILVHSSRYFSASIISALAAFFMTRFYTEVFTPSEFGIMVVYLMVFEYVVVLGSLSTESSIARKIFDYKDNKLNIYLSTMFWFYCSLCTLVLVVSLIFSGFISNWIEPDSIDTYIAVVLAGIVTIGVKFFKTICVNGQKSKEVSLSLIFNNLYNHSSSIASIYLLGFGVVGRFIGVIVGGLVQLYTLSKLSTKSLNFSLSFNFEKNMLKETLYLALPTICSSILILLLSYADRIFLKEFSGDESVGLYGLALIIGKLITIAFDSMFNSVFPMTMKKLTDDYNEGMRSIESLSTKYYIFLFFLLVGVIALSPVIYTIVASGSYTESQAVLPFVVIGIVLGGLYKIPSIVLSYHKVVWFYLPVTLVSFSANAILNYFLIPRYGIVGAGLSTCVGYFLYSSLVQFFSWGYFGQRYKYMTLISYLTAVIILVYYFYENYHI